MTSKYITVNNLKVSEELFSFINDDLLKDSGISTEIFWQGFDKAVHELAPRNRKLIKKRENLQKKIDEWHIKNKGNDIKIEEYKNFLKEIGYLKDEGSDFKIQTKNVDDDSNVTNAPLIKMEDVVNNTIERLDVLLNIFLCSCLCF